MSPIAAESICIGVTVTTKFCGLTRAIGEADSENIQIGECGMREARIFGQSASIRPTVAIPTAYPSPAMPGARRSGQSRFHRGR